MSMQVLLGKTVGGPSAWVLALLGKAVAGDAVVQGCVEQLSYIPKPTWFPLNIQDAF